MGCNCKNKDVMARPKVKETLVENNVIEVSIAPPYTREEVIKVKDYISSTTKTEEGRLNLIDFNEKYFGEKIVGYCDQPCMTRVRQRLETATKLLNEWDIKNKI